MTGIDQISRFLLWCSIFNAAVLCAWFAAVTLARDWINRLVLRWFRLPQERLETIHYSGMVLYKLLLLFFNIIPYLAIQLAR